MAFASHRCAQLGQFGGQVSRSQGGCAFNAYRYGAMGFRGGP
jgi:hypothetical protein